MKNKFSVIIPVKEINDYIIKFVPKILNQTYGNFEIIILPDDAKNIPKILKNKKIRIIGTGSTGPAQKRDLGAKNAKGNILAFIDDDAYPDERWLEQANEDFKPGIAGVGGPNLTPEDSNFFQKVSGKVLASYVASGPVYYRYKKDKMKDIVDFPSCNLFIDKKIFLKVGGFDTGFWPGEDTKLCMEITKIGGKIIYDPEVIVYHHRRKDLKGYLQQIFSYALHRGFFARQKQTTSLKLSYFIPSIFVLGLVVGSILSLFSSIIAGIYLFALIIYVLILIVEALRARMFFIFILLVFMTNVVYGMGFLIGFSRTNLRSKYRK